MQHERKMITTTVAAKMLDVHRRTVIRWCTLAEEGMDTPIGGVGISRTASGRFKLSHEDVKRIADGLFSSKKNRLMIDLRHNVHIGHSPIL